MSKRIHFPLIDSTNLYAKNNTSIWAKEGLTLITADEQSNGRGSHKRKWLSPTGNLYATFCFWLPLETNHLGHLTEIMALSAITVLEKYGLKGFIKWPNDILVEKRKIAGILCETLESDGKRGVICGIGLNINMSKEQFEKADLKHATSILIESSKQVDIEAILTLLEKEFVENLKRFCASGFSSFVDAFCRSSAHKPGDQIKVFANGSYIEGIFQGFSDEAFLLLKLETGKTVRIHSGELTEY